MCLAPVARELLARYPSSKSLVYSWWNLSPCNGGIPARSKSIPAGPYIARLKGFQFVGLSFGLPVAPSFRHSVPKSLQVLTFRPRKGPHRVFAQDLLGDDFNLIMDRPVARDPARNRRLQQLISFALHAERSSAQAFPPIVVDRAEAPWLLVEAMPVTAFGSDLFSSGRVILLLTDLTAPLRPEATQLCAAFGLTVAEAKLAAKLASGVGIDGAAASLGVSRETARTQLKAVFAKTKTRRQAELAALVSRLRS
jgi:DNA-binding CsgD family transcriptional regulator